MSKLTLVSLLSLLLGTAIRAQTATSSHAEWRADLNQLVLLLETEHPDAWTKVTKTHFLTERDALAGEMESLSNPEIIVRMMQLVALIRDGHTTLLPTGKSEFVHWFPLRFYRFSDGIFITAANQEYQDLIGARVLEIGNRPAADAYQELTALVGSDNEIGRSQKNFFLSSADALLALGIIDDREILPLSLKTGGGESLDVEVKSFAGSSSIEWRFWGEMYAPVPSRAEGRMPLWSGNMAEYSSLDASDSQKAELPLHLKSRRAYWYEYLPEDKTIYLHLTHLTADGRGEYESFQQFQDALFRFVEENSVEKFILDIRYASGGDGSVVTPFIHGFIRCDKLREKGRLYTLVGRKTYSAAIMLMDAMLEHTNTVLVGEPAGAPPNHYGDPGSFKLTNSGLTLYCSTAYWQLTDSRDKRRNQEVDVPAVFSGADYFAGRDPAVDWILDQPGPYRTIPELFAGEDLELAVLEYEERRDEFEGYEWWTPFDLHAMRMVAREELFASGRREAAFAAWEVCVEHYPEAWRAWRDYGKALMQEGETERAKEVLMEALRLNPGDSELQGLVGRLRRED